jgi:hypothetical protein
MEKGDVLGHEFDTKFPFELAQRARGTVTYEEDRPWLRPAHCTMRFSMNCVTPTMRRNS